MPKSMPGRMWIFIIKRGSYRGIDLYKNCIYEIDGNVGKVLIKNDFAVAAVVDHRTKWTLQATPEEYLKSEPSGSNAMKARQLISLKRGVVMLPFNYKEKSPEPVILEETPHQAREQKKEKPEPEPIAEDDSVSE